jgi:hypothetical protein
VEQQGWPFVNFKVSGKAFGDAVLLFDDGKAEPVVEVGS